MILCSRGNAGSSNKIQCLLHKSKCCQEWLANNVPAFICVEVWTSGSPDLNPLDYELWDILESNACWKYHPNLEWFKWSIIAEAVKIPLGRMHKCIAQWPESLRLCIDNEGGHFEWILAHSNCILVLFTIIKKFFVRLLVHESLRFKVPTVFMARLCTYLCLSWISKLWTLVLVIYSHLSVIWFFCKNRHIFL